MAVTVDHLHAVVGYGYHLDRGIGHELAHHHRRVLITRLVVTEHADVLQPRQLQVVIDGSCRAGVLVGTRRLGHLGSHVPRRVVITPVGLAVQPSVHVEVYGPPHVAEQELGHLQRELAHVELAERQPVVGQVVIQVVGITHKGRLVPVYGPATAAVPPHVDVLQLVDVVLHRKLRQGVDLFHRGVPLRRMVLVVVVLMGEHRVGHVALHKEVGVGILAEHRGIAARHHGLTQGVLLLVGLQVQEGGTVERRYLEHEPAVHRLLAACHNLVAHHQLGLYQHVTLQCTVVDAQLVVGTHDVAQLDGRHVGGRRGIVGGVAHQLQLLSLRLLSPRVVIGVSGILVLNAYHAHTVFPRRHLV